MEVFCQVHTEIVLIEQNGPHLEKCLLPLKCDYFKILEFLVLNLPSIFIIAVLKTMCSGGSTTIEESCKDSEMS